MTPPEDVNAWPMVEQSVIPCVIIVIEKGSLFSCDIWIFGKFLIIRIVDLEHSYCLLVSFRISCECYLSHCLASLAWSKKSYLSRDPLIEAKSELKLQKLKFFNELFPRYRLSAFRSATPG